MTVFEAYQAAVEELKRDGFEDVEARLSARLLLDNLVNESHAHLIHPDKALLDGAHPESFFDAIERVSKGEPLAHVLNQREFYDLRFISDNRALIPRPETELLVEHVVTRFKNQDRVLIADLGTGSGCIAISIAHALPQSVVFATDVSRDALQLARLNAARHNVHNRVEF